MHPFRAQLTLRFSYQFRYLNDNLYSYSLPPGWRLLFQQLCEEVDAELTESEKKLFQWMQIKEKFGELRAYAIYGDRIEAPLGAGEAGNAVAEAGAKPHRTVIKGIADETRQRISAIVSRIAEHSMTTCFYCGAPGELRTARAWVIPTCAAHINTSRHDFPSDV